MKTESTINYNANTLVEAHEYMKYRSKQLLKFGYHVSKPGDLPDGVGVFYTYTNNRSDDKYVAIYILEQYRGNNLYIKNYKESFQDYIVVTLAECNMVGFLLKNQIPCKYHEHDYSYKFVQEFYGDQRAKRSDVPYIYHIDEGLGYMDDINASDIAKQAYSLHPILQGDEDFNQNRKLAFKNIPIEALLLAVEYRRVANSYLSKGSIDDFVGFTNDDIHAMLYADKMQNRKDFLKYHYGTHERSEILNDYFNNWMDLLKNYKK